jgi:glutamate dehydrogenase
MPATLQQVQARIVNVGGDEGELLYRFAEQLLAKADAGFLEAFDSEALYALAVDGLAFLDRYDGRGASVEVYQPSFQADGWESPYTVVRLVMRDRPFIVDSMRNELRRRDVELYHLLHPIYSVERGDDGAVQALGDGVRDGRREAFEMFFVQPLDDEERAHLQASVERVLGDVLLATADYAKMRKQTRQVADYLRELRSSSAQGVHREIAPDLEEFATFMDWLDDDNFVFLGYREYDILRTEEGAFLSLTEGSGLGILSKTDESAYREPVPLEQIPEGLRERVTGGRMLVVTKTNAESTVHRSARLDYVGVKKLSDDWQVLGEQRFVGLFTSKGLSTPVEETPILRRKLQAVLDIDHATPESHDYKQIVSVFNTMPREELFWADGATLHDEIRTIMALVQERGVRLTLRPDPLMRGLGVMVIMPRDRFNAEVRRSIQDLLFEELQASHVDYQLAMGEDEAQLRFHFFFITDITSDQVDVKSLEREVMERTRSWEDHLRDRLVAKHGEAEGRSRSERYLSAFDDRYKADTASGSALRDIDLLERLGDEPFLVDLLNPVEERGDHETTRVRIYHRRRSLVLSDVLPLLENLGFRVLEQISYQLALEDAVRGIDVFRVVDLGGDVIDVRRHGPRVIEALENLLRGDAEHDRLNRLVLYAGLSVREVALLRGYQMYYAQLNAETSRRFVNETLLTHPQQAARLFAYFDARFDPAFEGDREAAAQAAAAAFADGLDSVSSLPEDRALRGLFDLMAASVRTNYYLGHPHISFKIDSQRVATMPDPRPLYEIGVIAPGVEGTHLRGGLVARGGIRWSDRPDDFRTEVLGLMKTQMTKNAVIVPVGSKGGFVIKRAPEEREALLTYVREQYRTFIRALLDLTDNRIDEQVVVTEGLVLYDDPDPYLVVAADKGTATYSDTANEISAEYDFWLGDAFASGGSQGYDHKEEGITARGAWECVARHFRELDIDVFRDPITAAGVGDMSGDVFGNGMLYTDRLRLQAAFNHLHIFLDPDPDPEPSYAERKRLFDLPRSSWNDYDPERISEGGGVFDRSSKAIALTPQVQAMLGIDDETLSGQDLIRAILKMPVDLLWNGGIGTYVRASSERDAEVGDAANDAVRIDATELRARVVGEGGNLGFTQLGRIEYAALGGRNNTDAIDNSAGVDMSDHEVNIKVLLQPLATSGELSMVQRNRLLKEMTDEVSALVLRDNYHQSLALSLAERRSREDVNLFYSLQEYLAERGDLHPRAEFMPTRRAVEERAREGLGFVRPELAILLAYAKMGLFRRLLETEFPDEPYFQHYLFAYFPEVLRERFPEAIRQHPLRREIIATQFTNTVVDILGITFVHRSIRDSGATAVEVIRAALIALEILDVHAFLERTFALDNRLPTEAQYEALHELVRAVEGVTTWMLLNDLSQQEVETFVGSYRGPLKGLRDGLEASLPGPEKRRFRRSVKQLVKLGHDEPFAAEIASFEYLPSSVGVIEVSHATGVGLDVAAKRFYALGERLSLGWLRDRLEGMATEGKWEKIALGGLVMDLRQAQRGLTERYVERQQRDGAVGAEAFLATYPNLLRRYDQVLNEVRTARELDLASGGVLVRLLTQAAAG